MKVSVHAFLKPDSGECIGTVNDADKLSFVDLKLDIFTLFNNWITKTRHTTAICKILFIHDSGKDTEWIAWKWGHSATCYRYMHDVYMYENQSITLFSHAK